MPVAPNLGVRPAGFAAGRNNVVELPATPTSREMALLLACLRWPVSAEVSLVIARLAQRELDWTFFLALVGRHRVFGLVEHSLRGAGVTIPEPQKSSLCDQAKRTSWSELILAGELRAIQDGLQASHVQPTILKGVALSMKAYGRLGLRYNRDIDLLVPWGAVKTACDLLENRGYERIEPPAKAGAAEVERWLRRQKDLVYEHAAKGLMVEIHWRLFDNPHLLRFEDHGRRDKVAISADFMVETLPADLDLIFICAHGAHHAWSRLKWIVDVNAIFAQMSPDEMLRVYSAARTMNVHRMVAQALILCSSLLGLAIPAEVVADQRADWRIRALARVARHIILARGATEIEETALGSTPKNIAHYLLTDGFAYFINEILFDLTDLSGTRVGNAPLVLVPVIRVYLWFARHMKMSLKLPVKTKP